MIVFLTGGSRGIGKHIKKVFEEKGFDVIAPTRQELDLSSFESITNYITDCKICPDVVINNAGVNHVENVLDFSRNTFYNMMNVNFISHVTITNHFVKKSKTLNKKLSIINIGSIRIQEIKTGRIHYTIAKTCMDIYTKYLIHEYGNSLIRCNTVSPGYVATDMLVRNNEQDKLKKMLSSVPLERFCNPIEIAKAVYNIAIDNRYINGQNIIIDGGKACR
jgi:NAD(P)-dependent dehydrogenase (short-subunit alcohol dehydrogenase family)